MRRDRASEFVSSSNVLAFTYVCLSDLSRLTIEAQPQDGGYLAYFPTLPGCQTWGETYEAAVRNAEEALAVFVETLIANGDPVPEAELRGGD